MGSGAVKSVELSDVVEEDWSEFLATMNLKIKTSTIFQTSIQWHCRDGICKNTMQMLNEEFNTFRGLFPLKLFITGPPASGKTFYTTKLAEAYGIP